MSETLALHRTTIAKKAVMAVTGVILFGFVLVHMIGNLQIFAGTPEKINAYGAFLHSLGKVLWFARGVLLVSVVVHIASAVSLTRQNRAARPQAYAMTKPRKSTYASRTMVWGGPIVLAFLVYHLMQFTIGGGGVAIEHDAQGRIDVYHNVIAGFSSVPVVVAYVVAQLALGLHLQHGVWSMFNSLGVYREDLEPAKRAAAGGFALLVVAGNLSIPLAVLFKVVT